ncbi:MAG: hypothetical protein QM811_12800 [Pirellulales bacterium]
MPACNAQPSGAGNRTILAVTPLPPGPSSIEIKQSGCSGSGLSPANSGIKYEPSRYGKLTTSPGSSANGMLLGTGVRISHRAASVARLATTTVGRASSARTCPLANAK